MKNITRSASLPKWVWNITLDEITEEDIFRQFKGFRDQDGYDGVMIVLWGEEGYMGEKFFERYEMALRSARALGMHIVIWDENGFPSGHADSEIEKKFPEFTAHRLDLEEYPSQGGQFSLQICGEGLEGIAALESKTNKCLDISDMYSGGLLSGSLPAGDWRIMVFRCVQAGQTNASWARRRLMDYLNPEAVAKFIELTHDKYYTQFAPYFGGTITHAFYDEPSFWHVEGGRIWSRCFKDAFIARHGFSPVVYYPALFGEVGPDTAKARTALLRLRSDLYRDSYVGQLADWCKSHGITLTGHMDQEEIVNPVPISGDLLKVVGRNDVPGVDEISKYRRGTVAYKLVSSAAANYGKEHVMCEVFGAMGEEMDEDIMLKEAIDLTAKGVDLMVPHGTWYSNDPKRIIFPPELSFRSEKFAKPLAEFNGYVKACYSMLDGKRLNVSAAVLYPIDDLYAGYSFGGENPAYTGGIFPEHTDYIDIGEALSVTCRRDFIYLHPEVLGENCHVGGGLISLENGAVDAQIRLLLLPSCAVIDTAAYERVLEFVNSGGVLVACGLIPVRASDGNDGRVSQITRELFGEKMPEGSYALTAHSNNGRAYRMDGFNPGVLSAVEEDAGIAHDIILEASQVSDTGFITCMHKSGNTGGAIYAGNSSDDNAAVSLYIKGNCAPAIYDPHTGVEKKAAAQSIKLRDQDYTRVDFDLPSLRSVIVLTEEDA